MDNNSTVTSAFGVQKIGKGRSPLLPKEKDPSFNLRDRLNDILASEKYIMDGYRIGSNELIDEQLYNLVMSNLDQIKTCHRNMLTQIFDLGEYQADMATPAQITDAYDMFNKYKVQLPYPQQNQ
jgi:hypothetical protein